MDLISYQAEMIAAAQEAIDGHLSTLHANLYQSPIDLTVNTELSCLDANIANYDGYAEKTVTWGPVTIADDGKVEVLGTITSWRPTGANVDNQIYGIWFETAADGLLLAGAFDDGPLPMTSNMDQITTTIRYRPDQPSLLEVIS